MAASPLGRKAEKERLCGVPHHAAVLARSRVARTLRASLVRLRPRRGQEGLRPPAPPGRNLRFLHLPLFTQSHAALLARPRVARTLRDFFVRLRPRRGQEGLRPPAPPGRNLRFLHLPLFTQSHAAMLARPRVARTLRDSLCGCGRTYGVTCGGAAPTPLAGN